MGAQREFTLCEVSVKTESDDTHKMLSTDLAHRRVIYVLAISITSHILLILDF